MLSSRAPEPRPTARPARVALTTPADAARDAAQARANAEAATLAASTLHAYLGALPDPDRSRADAYWSGGGPGTPADDALLRGLTGLRGMRIENDPPHALDRESPPRAFEIPVRLRSGSGSAPR
ncbi:hypothetical protein [Cellulomonas sp.]|uniref:hypothetical protein n=1 Tax=Cellulomonas sp. TaxID=40001 RepID=UPI001B07E256|nr:hypothetical protein [Cellulomonas sp.]MBO9556676.1 hypothetical protein [Cellulomonas sp.]